MAEHALLSPSSSERWLTCTPSVRLTEKLPNPSSVYADEGTLMHEYGATGLELAFGKIGRVHAASKMMDISRHELYKPEMDQYAKDYVQFCLDAYQALGKDAWPLIEHKFDISEWAPESFGTSDFSVVGKGILHIIDLKYGQGVHVTAEENTQLLMYALGVARVAAWYQDIHTVKMTIYQPRLDNISTWEITSRQLVDWADAILKPKAKQAFNGEGKYVPGDHCRFCRARPTCKALANYNLELAKFDFQSPELMSNHEIAEVLTKAPVYTNWINSVIDYATLQAKGGKKYPGWKIVEATSKRIIKDQKAAIAMLLKAGYKREEIITSNLVSLTELHKVLGRGDYHKLLQQYVIKPKGAPKLVPVTDKRSELNSIDSAIDDFKHLNF